MANKVKLTQDYSRNYTCPTCGSEPPDPGEIYLATKSKIEYPQYFNNRKYYNGSYDMHDWEELHYCKKCKKEYWFHNGAV